MKHLFTILLVAISATTFAQGNLQFNQVINDEYTGLVITTGSTLGTLTVPAGKVWKIEFVSFTSNTNPSYPSVHSSGGTQVFINNYNIYAGYNGAGTIHFPLWLSEGGYPVKARQSSNGNSTLSISAIEFNVIP
jgi:hypothetical protein